MKENTTKPNQTKLRNGGIDVYLKERVQETSTPVETAKLNTTEQKRDNQLSGLQIFR